MGVDQELRREIVQTAADMWPSEMVVEEGIHYYSTSPIFSNQICGFQSTILTQSSWMHSHEV